MLHCFAVGRVFEQEDVGWLKGIVAGGPPRRQPHLRPRQRAGDAPGGHPVPLPARTLAHRGPGSRRRDPRQRPAGHRGHEGAAGPRAGRLPHPRRLRRRPARPARRAGDAPRAGLRLGQQPLPAPTRRPGRWRSPAPRPTTSIVRAQAEAQPFAYPDGLIEVPMSPISDIGAFRTGRWRLDWFLKAVRPGRRVGHRAPGRLRLPGAPVLPLRRRPRVPRDRPDLRPGPQGRRPGPRSSAWTASPRGFARGRRGPEPHRPSGSVTARSRVGPGAAAGAPSSARSAGSGREDGGWRSPPRPGLVRLEQGVEGAAGQERPLDRPGRLAGEHHRLDAVEQEREVGGGPGLLGPELGRLDPPVVLDRARRRSSRRRRRSAPGGRPAGRPRTRRSSASGSGRPCGSAPCPARRPGTRRKAASNSSGSQSRSIERLPDGVAAQASDGADAGLAPLSLLGERLHGLQGVEAVGVGRPVGEGRRSARSGRRGRRRRAGGARSRGPTSRP